jgi:hypothetical protein
MVAAALQVVLTQGRLMRVAVTATKYQLEDKAAAAATTTTGSSSTSLPPGAAAAQTALHQSVTNAFSFLFMAAAPGHLVPQVVPHSLEEVGEYLEALRAQRAAAERPSGGSVPAAGNPAQTDGSGMGVPVSKL